MRSIPPKLARAIRLVVLDVDGVLTNGSVYLGDGGRNGPIELKAFDIQDGLGVKMLMWAGIEVAIVSGRVSMATEFRAKELGVGEYYQDPEARKIPLIQDILERKGIEWGEVAMVADDLPDLPALRRVGLPASVANAVPEVRREASWWGEKRGGEGAVREFARALLTARGDWDRLVEEYCEARRGG